MQEFQHKVLKQLRGIEEKYFSNPSNFIMSIFYLPPLMVHMIPLPVISSDMETKVYPPFFIQGTVLIPLC